mgnify:CR=1 FL=1
MKRIIQVFSMAGLDTVRLYRTVIAAPKILRDALYFLFTIRDFRYGRVGFFPILSDLNDLGGDWDTIYFLQDQIVARHLFEANVSRHCDVGSRVDGFILAISSFMEEVIVGDLRAGETRVKNVKTEIFDLLDEGQISGANSKWHSISCLHTLEHLGLGRYGDRLCGSGWRIGLGNLIKRLENGGSLILSVPVGERRTFFNAHRVFDPSDIIEAGSQLGVELKRFVLIDDNRNVSDFMNPPDVSNLSYGCGIFFFCKPMPNDAGEP